MRILIPFSLLMLVFLCGGCSGLFDTADAGGTSGQGNAIVAGIIAEPGELTGAQVEVRLIPKDFDPKKFSDIIIGR